MKITRKQGLEFRSSFYTVVLISMVVIALGVSYTEWNSSYNQNVPFDLQDFDNLDTMSAEAGDQKTGISPQNQETGEEFESTTFRGVFGILKNIYAPFKIVFGADGWVSIVTDRFGLPDWVRQSIVTLMIFAITFALIAIIFRIPRRAA